MKKIILASQSRARKLLLSSLGIPFVTIPSNINEKVIRDSNLSLRAKKLARAKASKVLETEKGIIITADTFSEIEGRVLEKPENKKEAIEMLNYISNKGGINYTALCFVDKENNINYLKVIKTKYQIREIFEDEIEKYVNLFPVIEWAAGFALIEPYMTSFIKSVEGSYTALAYGLPTEELIPLLKKSGFDIKPIKFKNWYKMF